MGCGAYLCPPRFVSKLMKQTILEVEFHGWFKQVVFAIYSTPSNGGLNFSVFEEVFKDVKLNTTLDEEETKNSTCAIL
jgi:hypothetical protein